MAVVAARLLPTWGEKKMLGAVGQLKRLGRNELSHCRGLSAGGTAAAVGRGSSASSVPRNARGVVWH